MHVTIGMIVLNEEQYVAQNLMQHYQFADRIVIVEGADLLYPRERVTADGLSSDNTAEIIRDFPDPDRKIQFIQHGWTQENGPQGKCELRSRYLDGIKPGLLIVIDADEFYRREDLSAILAYIRQKKRVICFAFPTLHFWRNTTQFITGGYYDVSHTRFWRVRGGERYITDHNIPEKDGALLWRLRRIRGARRVEKAIGGYRIGGRVCYHLGFCKSPDNTRDKNSYYLSRGEGETRAKTTVSRAAWFGDDANLPTGHRIWPYAGPLPEVLAGRFNTLRTEYE